MAGKHLISLALPQSLDREPILFKGISNFSFKDDNFCHKKLFLTFGRDFHDESFPDLCLSLIIVLEKCYLQFPVI